jgi:L-2-hydroxyglutarate oxidase LhgO
MTVVHNAYTVGTTPVLIAEIPEKNPTTSVHIVNDDNNSIYVGDSAVATSGADKGMTVKKDSIYTLELNALDKLYAVAAVATGANAVSVVYSRVI